MTWYQNFLIKHNTVFLLENFLYSKIGKIISEMWHKQYFYSAIQCLLVANSFEHPSVFSQLCSLSISSEWNQRRENQARAFPNCYIRASDDHHHSVYQLQMSWTWESFGDVTESIIIPHLSGAIFDMRSLLKRMMVFSML